MHKFTEANKAVEHWRMLYHYDTDAATDGQHLVRSIMEAHPEVNKRNAVSIVTMTFPKADMYRANP